MMFDIRLGATVVGDDLKRVGRVDGLVVDPDDMNLIEIIVHHGRLRRVDRIVDMHYVDGVEEDGTVRLNIDATRAEALPPLVTHEYVVANTTGYRSYPFSIGGGPTMNPPVMWRAGAVGQGMHVSDPAGYLAAVIEAAPVEVRSDLPRASVVVDTGTDVIGIDGEKIGTIEDVLYDDQGQLAGFVARTGFVQHHDILIPIETIDTITHKYMRLNVTAQDARAF